MAAPNDFDSKLEAVKDLVNAKFDGVNKQMEALGKTLERVVDAIEKQAEHNTALAVIGSNVTHLEAGLASHRSATTVALSSVNKRLSSVESRSAKNDWRLGSFQAAVVAVGGAVAALVTDNLHEIALFFGKA